MEVDISMTITPVSINTVLGKRTCDVAMDNTPENPEPHAQRKIKSLKISYGLGASLQHQQSHTTPESACEIGVSSTSSSPPQQHPEPSPESGFEADVSSPESYLQPAYNYKYFHNDEHCRLSLATQWHCTISFQGQSFESGECATRRESRETAFRRAQIYYGKKPASDSNLAFMEAYEMEKAPKKNVEADPDMDGLTDALTGFRRNSMGECRD